MTRKVFTLLFFAATFAVVASAQRYGSSTCGLTPGPCVERFARQGYAPIDYYLNNGYGYGYGYGGYGYYGGRLGVSALVGAATGAIAGGVVAAIVSRRSDNRAMYAVAPDGGQYYTSAPPQGHEVRWPEPKRQKPLDCRKPSGKNKAACEAAAAEVVAQQQIAEGQGCLDQLASSSWRLRNGSDRFTFYPTVGSKQMVICGEPVVLRPLQTIRIFPPDGQIGGKSFGAGASGERVEFEAKVQATNRPGFIGFVLMAPGAPEGGN